MSESVATKIAAARLKLVRVGWCQNAWVIGPTANPTAYSLLAALGRASPPYDDLEHLAVLRFVEICLPAAFRFAPVDPADAPGYQFGSIAANLSTYNDAPTTTKAAVLTLLNRASLAARVP